MFGKLIASIGCAFMVASAADATVTIANTGNNTAWTVAYNGSSATAATVTNPIWFGNTTTSSWISVDSSGTSVPPISFVYSTSFSVTGAADTLNYRFAADDYATKISLDGNTVQSGQIGNYYGFTSGALSAGLGTHTLSFTIANPGSGNNPSGFRFEGTTPAVPEVATWAMMVGGFGVIGAASRRRAKTFFYA